jgi:hypothetical protein
MPDSLRPATIPLATRSSSSITSTRISIQNDTGYMTAIKAVLTRARGHALAEAYLETRTNRAISDLLCVC